MTTTFVDTLRVHYELDVASGWWAASVPMYPGCHTQGRTKEQAAERLRDALANFIDNADSVVLVDEVS